MPYPPKPAQFSAVGAPVGVEVKFVTFYTQRAVMKAPPRLQLVHTNAASGTGTIESAWNWSHAKPNANTLPHYQVDRSGRARKMLPSNRVGIANATVDSVQAGHGDVRDFSLAYETADDGYGPGRLGDESGFTPAQAETLAGILAYESVTHGIPLDKPTQWYGAGTAGHTSPFTYPYWTMYQGKTCPGRKKLEQLWNEVLPRARAIKNVWTFVLPDIPDAPPDDEGDDVRKILVRHVDGRMFCTDLMTYAHHCTEGEGEVLRDRRGAEVDPKNGNGPFPIDAVESDYVARMAG